MESFHRYSFPQNGSQRPLATVGGNFNQIFMQFKNETLLLTRFKKKIWLAFKTKLCKQNYERSSELRSEVFKVKD